MTSSFANGCKRRRVLGSDRGRFDGYRQHIDRHVLPTLGRIPLVKLTPQHVQHLLKTLADTGLSPRTIAYARAVLRAALQQAQKWGLVGRNVAQLVDPPRLTRHEFQVLTPEEARRFLEKARDDRLGALYTVALSLGLRLGEALGLRWADVDLDNNTLQVRQALQRFGGDSTIRGQLVKKRHELLASIAAARAAKDSDDIAALSAKLADVRGQLLNQQTRITFRPLADQINASLAQERVVAMLSGFFGGLAVLLAGLGLFGVTSYSVSRRRREIGIRIALGAAPNAVLRLVLARVFLLVGIGVVIGAGVSLWATVGNPVRGIAPLRPRTARSLDLRWCCCAADWRRFSGRFNAGAACGTCRSGRRTAFRVTSR